MLAERYVDDLQPETERRMTPRDFRLDWALTALVAIALVALYLAVQRGDYVSWDGRIMAGTAKNIWENGRFQTFGPYFPDETRLVEAWSQYGIGQSLLMVPFYGIQSRVDPNGAQIMTLPNMFVLAAAAAILYRIGVALRFRRSTCVGMALVFGALTMAPMYSTELFAEPAATLGTVVVVLALIRWRQGRSYGAWMMGFGIGVSILFRIDTLLLTGVAVLTIPLFVPWQRLKATVRDWLPALGVPLAGAGLWQAYYNNLRYGSPFQDSYAGVRFDNPVIEGLQRQLLSPGKGFFWYDPILIAAIPGLVWLWRRDRALAGLIIGLCTLRVVFCARTPFADGSVAWGPRYLLPWCALLAIPLGVCWERVTSSTRSRRIAGTTAFGLLIALSAIVVLASTWVSYVQYWSDLGEKVMVVPADQMQPVTDKLIDESYYTIDGSPLVVNLRALDNARPFPLRWFRGGPTVFGVLAVSSAVAAAAAAVVVARKADRREVLLGSPCLERTPT